MVCRALSCNCALGGFAPAEFAGTLEQITFHIGAKLGIDANDEDDEDDDSEWEWVTEASSYLLMEGINRHQFRELTKASFHYPDGTLLPVAAPSGTTAWPRV